MARPSKAAGHLEPLARLERRIAVDRIFLVGRGQADDGEWVERHDDVAVHVERADELGIVRFLVGEKAPDQPFETSAAHRGEPPFLRPFLEPAVEREGWTTRRNCAFGETSEATRVGQECLPK